MRKSLVLQPCREEEVCGANGDCCRGQVPAEKGHSVPAQEEWPQTASVIEEAQEQRLHLESAIFPWTASKSSISRPKHNIKIPRKPLGTEVRHWWPVGIRSGTPIPIAGMVLIPIPMVIWGSRTVRQRWGGRGRRSQTRSQGALEVIWWEQRSHL